MKKLLILSLMFQSFMLSAQDKKSLTWDEILKWNRITNSSISDNGEYVAIQSTPWVGDAKLELFDSKTKSLASFESVKSGEFLTNDIFVVVQQPTLNTKDSLERAKSKDKPSDKLIVYNIKNNTKTVVDSLKSHKIAKDAGVVAYTRGEKDCKTLFLNTNKGVQTLENVDNFVFSKNEEKLAYYTNDSVKSVVYIVDLKGFNATKVYESDKYIKKIALSNTGDALAFLSGDKKDKSGVSNELYYYKNDVQKVGLAKNTPNDWVFNEFGELSFSKEKGRLTFAVSPRYIEPDTLSLKREKAVVDVWTWNEPTLHTVQLNDREKDLKKSYKSIFLASENRSLQLEDEAAPRVVISEEGDGDVVLSQTNEPYKIESMWTGRTRSDLYLTNLNTGKRELIEKDIVARVSISPKGKYLYWYQQPDSSWYSYSIAKKAKFKLTSPEEFTMYDDLNDVPDYPYEQGAAGWLENDEMFYVYGKHDIWALDPERKTAPCCVTQNGRSTSITYRVVNFDDEKKFFTKKDKLFLETFDNTTKGSGYAVMPISGGKPVVLASDLIRFGTPVKAKNSDNIIFTQESFEKFPDMYLSDLSLKNVSKITNVNPQQADFNWGTAELVEWVSYKGDTLQGLLYKPENFDPKKKYPMICNFYEKDSYNLFAYKTPETHRSTIDYHYYTSNGYVIFNPDVKYTDGHPGQSCYDAVLSGLDMVLEMGFVDPKRIGAQGHSWGGYQVAHLATKTDRFAAIESGAPVVNMLSAYGGVRWATGLVRAFQYEHGQSRIGKSIWEAPDKYLENSPLMNMDKVKTPILIMHNDSDGHVPWWQGIEYFTALRRLQKPVWLLNYNGEPHWPLKQANQIDFQTRMSQFFHHYLKGEPMPKWMEEGVPAVNKFN